MTIRETSQPTVSPQGKQSSTRLGVSVVVPAYNEENGIAAAIRSVKQALASSSWEFEIIVVDDGSTDATADRAEILGVPVLRLGVNRGYGAALKAGIARAEFEWVAIIDADGTYPATEIPRMLELIPAGDMVVGARIGGTVRDPWVRRPAKWLLRKCASYLSGQHIPDLNSGMRVIRKAAVEKFAGILPSGFSFTTTITLAMISSGYAVAYVPIDYYQRVGSSKIRPSHSYKFALQIIRTMMLFRPLRVLGPVSAVLLVAGLGKLAFDLFPTRVSATDVGLLLASLIVWCQALVADQNARLRQLGR